MEFYKRIIGSVIVNGCLTALLWGTAIYIYLSNKTTYDNSFGIQIAIYLYGMMGMFAGCLIGFVIGWLNKSAFKSLAIGGIVCFVLWQYLIIMDTRNSSPFIDEVIRQILVLALPTVLAALSAGLTAKLFNRPFKVG